VKVPPMSMPMRTGLSALAKLVPPPGL
jgi:hypothetical protein